MIRAATPDDLDALLALGNLMRAESVTAWPEIDRERARKQLALSVEHPEIVLIAVAEHDGDVTGMVTGVAGDYAFSPERRTVCDLLFVRPDRRGLSAAMSLIGHFKAWSIGLGAKTAYVGNTTGVDPERMGKLFERAGFGRVGVTYRMELG